MPEVRDVIAQLVELKVSPDDFAKALKEGAQPLYQAVFDLGHRLATKENKDKIRDLETERDTEKQRANGLQTKLEEAEKAQPDLAAVRKQYDAELTAKADEIKELKKAHKAEIKGARLEAKRENLRALLNGIDPDYADIQVRKHEGRLDFDNEGNLIVLQDGKKIPIQADDPLKALADEIRTATPPKFVVSNADGGSGTETGGANNNRGAAIYEKIRKDVKEAEKGEGGARKSAAERLGAHI